ncbi:hypothetical protein [Bradyrhizobium diazoefficiens]
MADLESLILTEAHRQGCQPDQHAIRQASIDLAGAVLTSQGLIHLPGLGAISAADFTRSLRARMPEAFSTIDDKPQRPAGNLTAAMMAEVAASRKQARITDADLARFSGVTREHIEERLRAAPK